MKTEVNILRRIYDNYIPAEQICNYLNIEFKGVLKSTKDDLNVKFLDVIKDDKSEQIMICIHFDSIQKYIEDLQKDFDIDDKKIIRFLFSLHKYSLSYEKEIIHFLDNAYSEI